MSRITRFQDLECWKVSRKLTVNIYQLEGSIERDFGLKDQIRRASLSIMNNIAEGFSRFSAKEKIRFFEIAQSSACEVESMLYLLEDLCYLQDAEIAHLNDLTIKARKQIWSLIKYLRTQ